jgi:hypothetical protein
MSSGIVSAFGMGKGKLRGSPYKAGRCPFIPVINISMAQTREQQRLRNRDAQRQHRRRKTEEQGQMKEMLVKCGDSFRAVLLAPSIEEARMLALNALAALSEMTPRRRVASSQHPPPRPQESGPYGGMAYGLWPALPAPPPENGSYGSMSWWDPAGTELGYAMDSSTFAPIQPQACWPSAADVAGGLVLSKVGSV